METDARYIDPVALVAWLAAKSDAVGAAPIGALIAAARYEAEHHPARMVEARTLRISPSSNTWPYKGAK